LWIVAGIQAQTLSNLLLAMDAAWKSYRPEQIDLPGAEPDKRAHEIHDCIGTTPDEILPHLGKRGEGLPELSRGRRRRGSLRRAQPRSPLRRLIFDSYYTLPGPSPDFASVDGVVRRA